MGTHGLSLNKSIYLLFKYFKMSLTPSNMVNLGSLAPGFNLPDTITGTSMSLDELQSDSATLVMFLCNHCPYVKHIREEIVNIANEYMPKGVSIVAISSNDVEQYPEDSPSLMKKEALEWKYPFPYLYDESQSVAKSYKAACTPDFFLYGPNLNLVYRGQLDDSRPGNEIPLTGKDLRNALTKALNGFPITEEQIPSIGCNIKWKGSE